ncbi:hypothetical protein D9613_002159 [Agrocybe pediades]|uniref:Uncharacterized protein n=1 Tax=Agrocybe pediades TaxID=84607 RepID=A0A8H4R775_9AGAR|nr:hypothetical protein D9613_002159 [Agrocybe pediades]KAF9566125.1 hypothetical protein CPC08DRAFT_129023 [Agrocybe pediades]
MATRRRIGVSAATTEAARRQLMQPVPCWERVWTAPTGVNTGSSNLKVYKWVKTEKVQHFSDDEGEVDEPLAPLPDEPDVGEGDEDEADENKAEGAPAKDSEAPEADVNQDEPPSKAPSPKPQLMLQSGEEEPQDADGLDASLKPLDTAMVDGDDNEKDEQMEGLELDISALGPDGLQLEGAHDLSQLDSSDALIGGNLIDDSIDPFSETT